MIRRALALILGAGLVAALALAWIFAPHAISGGEVFVDVPKGTGTRQIAALLAEKGVIGNPLQFLLVRALRPKAKLQAGEYRFKQPANAWQVFDRISRGDIFYYVLSVPEGQNLYDIAAALEHEEIMPAAAFVEAAYDTAPIRDLDPKAPTLEGYLFPDTYRVTRHTTASQLCRQMTERFRKAWRQLGRPQADVHASVTLASLVEKEAKLPEERPLIASVFLNRLRIGMPLQCDPTTVYAAIIEQRYRGAIYRSDLDSKQVYNTYQHAGLPPGPIANPGLASLRAAIEPAAADYLYFVARADGSGGHQFSKELTEHARAVRRYRRGLRPQPPTI
jgi:UPF0755 protein